MEPSSAQIIECIRGALIGQVAPELPQGRTHAVLDLVDLALRELLRRDDSSRSSPAGAHESAHRFIASGIELLRRPDAPDCVTSEEISGIQIAGTGDSNAALARLVEQIAARRSISSQAKWDCDAAFWIEAVVQEEAALAATAAESRANHALECDAAASIDVTRLAAYLSNGLHIGTLRKVSVERIPGGFSRETLFVNGTTTRDGVLSIVIRRAIPRGLLEGLGLPLSGEFPLLRLAFESGLPVPRPLLLETGAAPLGSEFIVSEKAAGAVLGTAISATAIDSEVIREIARVLARLHQIRWEDRAGEILPALQLSPRDLTIRSAFESWLCRCERYLQDAHVTPSPTINAGLRWLHDNIPDRKMQLSVVHGDVGFHNMLFDEGRMTALLDWELADLGDPARDLAQMRRSLPANISWRQFLGSFVEAGGTEVPDEVIRYYEVYIGIVSLIVNLVAWESKFRAGHPPSIAYLQLGLTMLPFFYRQFATDGKPVWSPQGRNDDVASLAQRPGTPEHSDAKNRNR